MGLKGKCECNSHEPHYYMGKIGLIVQVGDKYVSRKTTYYWLDLVDKIEEAMVFSTAFDMRECVKEHYIRKYDVISVIGE